MSFIKDFEEFAFKGNILGLAVGVIIGAAFGKIVSSVVEDIITPILLNPALKYFKVEDIAKLSWNGLKYGSFLSAVISFLFIAFVLFWIIKGANRIKRPPTTGPTQEELLTQIRDILNVRNQPQAPL